MWSINNATETGRIDLDVMCLLMTTCPRLQLHSLVRGHYQNARDRYVVGLFEHETDRPADVRRLNKVRDVEHVLGVNREVVLQVRLDQTRLERTDAHARARRLHAQVFGQCLDGVLRARVRAGCLAHLRAENA